MQKVDKAKMNRTGYPEKCYKQKKLRALKMITTRQKGLRIFLSVNEIRDP